jgi:hypothetical protein
MRDAGDARAMQLAEMLTELRGQATSAQAGRLAAERELADLRRFKAAAEAVREGEGVEWIRGGRERRCGRRQRRSCVAGCAGVALATSCVRALSPCQAAAAAACAAASQSRCQGA